MDVITCQHVVDEFDYLVLKGQNPWYGPGWLFTRYKRYNPTRWQYEIGEEYLDASPDHAAFLEALYQQHSAEQPDDH